MIFIDSNIPLYLVGASHPNKDAARAASEKVLHQGERMATSAAVMQEILLGPRDMEEVVPARGTAHSTMIGRLVTAGLRPASSNLRWSVYSPGSRSGS